ncbi:MAG: hypothetical protein ACC653_07010, partial [Gammaproteobacteria bacterium]
MVYKLVMNKNLLFFISTLALSASLGACGFETSNKLPGVPPTGYYAAVGANQHAGDSSMEVAAAIFIDGEPVNLFGGDVIQASTTNDSALLLDFGYFVGSYTAELPNNSNLD